MLTKLEIKRQLFHMSVGITIVILLYNNIINSTVLLIVAVLGLTLSLTYRRYKIPGISFLLQKFDRKKDIEIFPGKGAVFYVLGSFFAVFLFPKDIAMASIMILAFGDSVSRLAGPYGYLKHPFHSEKFVEGMIAGAIMAFTGAFIFVHWILALSASAIAMFIEGFDIKIKGFKVDDNLTIPIVAGFVMWIIRNFIFYL